MAVFQVNFYADTLTRTVPIYVILPTDKRYHPGAPRREEEKPYKTLYLLHGILGNYTDWLYGTRIQRWAEERDLCVVMPSGDNSMYLDHEVDRYGEFIGRELVDFTRKTFPLSHKKEDTYIGGLSMGGFGAMRNGLKYHDTFGAIVSLSGAFAFEEDLLAVKENAEFLGDKKKQLTKVYGEDLTAAFCSDKNPGWLVKHLAQEKIVFPAIYMACGTEDFLLQKNEQLAKLLTDHHVDFIYEKGPGGHEWDFWDTYIKKALDWLPLEVGSAGKSSGNIGQ